MTKDEYDTLPRCEPKEATIAASDLKNQTDRTLLYGYDTDRSTWHVYLKGNMIHKLVYTSFAGVIEDLSAYYWRVGNLIPNKRLYPEACDSELCSLLLGDGVDLPFTAFNRNRQPVVFHGLIMKEGVLVAA